MLRHVPNDTVLKALLRCADQIGTVNRQAYMCQVRRNRYGRVTRGYCLTEAHQRVMGTIDAYARGRLADEEAMSVLHEYDVFKERFQAP